MSNAVLTENISIHAPTRGATPFLPFALSFILNFNPRSHEGSDTEALRIRDKPNDFNPRSHEGSDPKA